VNSSLLTAPVLGSAPAGRRGTADPGRIVTVVVGPLAMEEPGWIDAVVVG